MADENPPTNPYATMADDTLKAHLINLAAVLKGKENINLYDMFGLTAPLTTEQKTQLEMHDKFISAQIAKEAASTSTPVDEKKETLTSTQESIVNVGLDSQINNLLNLDSSAPINVIKELSGDSLSKLEFAKNVQPIIAHYADTFKTLKENMPKNEETRDKFNAPPSGGKHDELRASLAQLVKTDGDKQ